MAEERTSAGKVRGVEEGADVWGLLAFVLLLGCGAVGLVQGVREASLVWLLPGFFLVLYGGFALRVARQWEKAVVLRLGRLRRVAGPGPFLAFPGLDAVVARVDQRVIATAFNAEQTLTRDTVPVDVDAVLFWLVWDPARAVLEVSDYQAAVAWAAQTALREVIGRRQLAEILAAREDLDEELRVIIDQRTEPWGIAVQAVEIRDVIIPGALQEAMSREAQAERERRARIILGTAETEIALKFAEAARHYENNDVALQLRAMNILYEGLKEGGGLVVVPSQMVHSTDSGSAVGNLGGLTFLSQQARRRSEEKKGVE